MLVGPGLIVVAAGTRIESRAIGTREVLHEMAKRIEPPSLAPCRNYAHGSADLH